MPRPDALRRLATSPLVAVVAAVSLAFSVTVGGCETPERDDSQDRSSESPEPEKAAGSKATAKSNERPPTSPSPTEIPEGMCVKTRTKVDANANGTIEPPEMVVTYSYDEQGRRLRRSIDGNRGNLKDGEVDAVVEFAYDDRGRRVRKEEDRDHNGEPEAVTTHSYDDEGRRIRTEAGVQSGGKAEGKPRKVTTFEYDDAGRRTKKVEDGGTINGADGNPDYITTYKYDEAGHLVRKTERDTLETLTIRLYDYDAAGHRTRVEVYDKKIEKKGQPDHLTTYSYDDAGRRIRKEVDKLADGELDEVVTYEYDERGNRVRKTIDEPVDGQADTIVRHEWACADE